MIKPQLPEFGGFEGGHAWKEFSSEHSVVTGRDLAALLGQLDFVDPAMGELASTST